MTDSTIHAQQAVIARFNAAAKKYRSTYADHRNDPCNGEALEAWDKATAEFSAMIANDELNIIAALLDGLEAAEQRNAELVHNHCVHAARLIDERGQLKQRIAELEALIVNEWIEHDGKWRPESLGLDELVYLKTRKQELKIPYPAGKVMWMHSGGDMDVMAYKLATPQARTATVKISGYDGQAGH